MNLDADDLADLRRQRLMARSKMIRLHKEIRRYRALYRTAWIDRMVASLVAEYRRTWEWRRSVEAQLKSAAR